MRSRTASEYRCGGTLITKNVVLTAAHCLYDSSTESFVRPDRLTVHLGKNKIFTTDLYTALMQVFKIVPHPDYKESSSINDIALIVLSNDVSMSDYIQPVCLWKPALTDRVDENTIGQSLSWGKLFLSDEDAEDPRRVSMKIVEFDKCWSYIFIRHIAFCAGLGNGTETVCRNDNGAGLTIEFNGVSYLKGIMPKDQSFRTEDECNAENFVIFTDIEKYLPWILNQIKVYEQ